MFEFDKFCRICTRAECNLIDMTTFDKDSVKFCDKLIYCIPETSNDDDFLPNFICEQCCESLKVAFTFKKICIKTRSAFQNPKKSNQIRMKEEPKSDNENSFFYDELFVQDYCNEFRVKTEPTDFQNANCSICGEIFRISDSLETSDNSRKQLCGKCQSQKEEVFECEICSIRYANERLLASHMRSHTGEKPYECTECDERFSWNHHLQRHINKKHFNKTIPETFPCAKCAKIFHQQTEFNEHVCQLNGTIETANGAEQNGGPATVSSRKICSLQWARRCRGGPKRRNLVYCSICNKCSANNGLLRRHMLVMHDVETTAPDEGNYIDVEY